MQEYESLDVVNETNRYPFGKVHLKLMGIPKLKREGSLYIRIGLNPYNFETRKLSMTSDFTFN